MSSLSNFPDKELLAYLENGDRVAFTEIYDRYHGMLYVHVFNKLRDREESRDIVQGIFLSIWNNRHALKIQISLKSYLFSAARYRVFDMIRSKDINSKYMNSLHKFSESYAVPSDFLIREKQLLRIIDKEIAALPEKMREVFELSRRQHLSHKQIAEQLGISEQTVKKQINNSLKILRTKLGAAIFSAFVL